MTCRIRQLLYILLFALGIFHSHAAQAQSSCTPTLYLFRHGEDLSTGNGLTPVGLTHANLYPDMTNQLTNLLNLCPVKQVFAMWNRDTGTSVNGTRNPYQTALPLAQYAGLQAPIMFFTDTVDGHKYYFCEYPKDPNACEKDAAIKADGSSPHRNVLTKYSGDTFSHLYSYLSAYFQTNPNVSVAIFHTSDGMASVSGALGVAPVAANCSRGNCTDEVASPTSRTCPIPVDKTSSGSPCFKNETRSLSWPGIDRASVDIFFPKGSSQNLFENDYARVNQGLDQNHNLLQTLGFYQCYNYDPGAEKLSDVYYCTYSGNLANGIAYTDTTVGDTDKGFKPVKLSDIRAKICYAPNIQKNSATVKDSFGHCTEHPGPRNLAPHDLDANMVSDIIWRDTNGDIAIWLMNGAGMASSAGLGNVPATWSIVGQRDFDGDGTADLLWRDTSGNTSIWFMSGTAVASSAGVGNIPANWTVIATGDFNGDGTGDILWQDASGNLAMWLMNGATVLASGSIGNVPAAWSLAGSGDFDGDGMTDLLWRDNLGNTAIWFMSGTTIASTGGLGNIPTTWTVVGVGDFDGDGKSDVVWRDGGGNASIWLMNGAAVSSAAGIGNIPTTWSIAQTGDFNGDGKSDLLWRDTSGNTSVWFMNGTATASTASLGNIPTSWTVQSVNAD